MSPDDDDYGPLPEMESPWVQCHCEDWWCLAHGQHVYDCPCPPIEVWMEAGRDPYRYDEPSPESGRSSG